MKLTYKYYENEYVWIFLAKQIPCWSLADPFSDIEFKCDVRIFKYVLMYILKIRNVSYVGVRTDKENSCLRY